MEIEYIKKIIESLLFMVEQPISMARLQGFLQVEASLINEAIAMLKVEYESRGIRVFEIAGGYILGTAPECEAPVREFLESPVKTPLTKAGLEVLAIIAYRQPVTRGEVENIRGVNSDSVISSLIDKDLVTIVGKSEELGHPTLIGTTDAFLKQFGLSSLDILPSHPFNSAQLTLKLEQNL